MMNPRSLRLITINTWKCDGEYMARLEVLAESLKSLDADVIALQESFRSVDGRYDTARFLADHLGMHVEFAPARRKRRRLLGDVIESESGLALLSREAIHSSATVVLPSDNEDGERIALVGRFSWAGRRMQVANLHLTHLPGRANLRRSQFESLLSILSNHAECVTIVCGDFNTPLGEIGEVTGNHGGWEIHDAYEGATALSSRETIRGIGSDWPTSKCIDYIFVCEAAGGAVSVRCSDTRVVLNVPDAAGVFPSDHYGVWTTIEFLQGGKH